MVLAFTCENLIFMYLLKRFTLYILIVAIFIANFSTAFVWVGFKLNQDYIAQNLCVNRFNPGMHCNGKCYFMQKLKQAAQKEKSTENQTQKNRSLESFFISKADIKFYCHVLQVIPIPSHKIALPIVAIPIFQPPRIA